MKLKDFVKEKKMTIKALSEKAGLPYSTTNDIVNGIVSVDNVGLGKCKAIADCLGITLDEFFDLYNNVIKIADGAEVVVKNHGYYFKTGDREKYLFKANDLNAHFAREAGEWAYEGVKAQEELDELTKGLINDVE